MAVVPDAETGELENIVMQDAARVVGAGALAQLNEEDAARVVGAGALAQFNEEDAARVVGAGALAQFNEEVMVCNAETGEAEDSDSTWPLRIIWPEWPEDSDTDSVYEELMIVRTPYPTIPNEDMWLQYIGVRVEEPEPHPSPMRQDPTCQSNVMPDPMCQSNIMPAPTCQYHNMPNTTGQCCDVPEPTCQSHQAPTPRRRTLRAFRERVFSFFRRLRSVCTCCRGGLYNIEDT